MKKHIILIGIGQFGCSVIDRFSRTAGIDDGFVSTIGFDTDKKTAETITAFPIISMASQCRISDVLKSIDTDIVKQWFPCDTENECVEYFETLSMNEGSNQWRMKGLLSFYYFLSQPKNRDMLSQSLDMILQNASTDKIDIITVASLSGGTGSGLFLPLFFYIKRYFEERGVSINNANAMLALPDICEELMTPEQQIKARANAYATLRELNAIILNALNETTPFKFRIGDINDPVFGLLYDSESPDSKTLQSIPFDQIYLCRRMPGIRTLSYTISLFADTVRSICKEAPSSTLTKSDAVFSGISLTKSIYPLKDIVSYISNRYLCDTASDKWMFFFRNTEKEAKHIRSALKNKEDMPSDEAVISKAVMNTVGALREDGESNSAILNHKNSDSGKDNSPLELLSEDYVHKLNTSISDFYHSDTIVDEINRIIRACEPSKKRRFIKEPLWGRKDRKAKLSSFGLSCNRLIHDYYFSCHKLTESIDEYIEQLLLDESSLFSLTKTLLVENNSALHPAYALVRLSALYEAFESSIENRRAEQKEGKNALPDELPDWLIEANSSVHMNCRYDRFGEKRFSNILSGNIKTFGGKFADMQLFGYDLRILCDKMYEVFRTIFVEKLLNAIGKQIVFYYNFFKVYEDHLDERYSELKSELYRTTGHMGTVNYVGATKTEKELLYEKYLESLNDTDAEFELSSGLESLLGEGLLKSLTDVEDIISAETVSSIMDGLYEKVYGYSCNSEFYNTELNKNILEVILAQNGKNGTDTVTQALSKAFSGGIEPLIYTLPDTKDAFLISNRIKRTVSVYLPKDIRDYLEENKQNYNNDDPQSIINEFLFRAGEYNAQAVFSDTLPKNEIRVLRRTVGLNLSLLDPFSETSESPVYYKAYLKSLYMEKKQMTALWNPHLICGLDDSSLPHISK